MTLEEQNFIEKLDNILHRLSPEMLKKLNITLEKPEQPRLERWKPEKSQLYYYIASDFSIRDDQYFPTDAFDKGRWAVFNCYPSAIEAEQEAFRTRARRKLEWLARELNDKEDTGERFCIGNDFSVYETIMETLELMSVYFYTRKDAEYALSQMTLEELEALQ